MEAAPRLPAAALAKALVRPARRRWYCLVVCALVAGLQGGVWNNFGPVAEAMKPLFGWSNDVIALLVQWGPIGYVLAFVPTSWLLDRGVRAACVVASGLVVAGSLLRCAPPGAPGFTALMHAGQLLNALAGPVCMSVGPVLAATWFPPRERTTATSVVTLMSYGGSSATFVAGPWLVPSWLPADERRERFFYYMVAELALSVLVFLACWLLPARPPYPPSRSARVERVRNAAAWTQLRRRRVFWVLATAYGIISWFMAGWGAMLGPIVQKVLPPAAADPAAGWMGCCGALASILVGVPLAGLSDQLQGRKKGLCLWCCAGACVAYLCFALLCCGWGTPAQREGWLYVAAIAAVVFANATAPFFYELCVEATYPISEGVTTCVLTVINNVLVAAFLWVIYLPGGTKWMNWACVGGCALAFALVLPVREPRLRLAVDELATGASPTAAMLVD